MTPPALTHPAPFVAHVDVVDRDIQLVTCSGELDRTSADALKAAVDRTKGKLLVIDLTSVSFMDAAGVAVLLAARRRYPDGRLSVCCPPGTPCRVLEITGASELFLVRDTVDCAMATLSHQHPAGRTPRAPVPWTRGPMASEREQCRALRPGS